jgi:hypothetical protein
MVRRYNLNGISIPQGVCLNDTGVVGSRWAPRSSKPVAGRVAGRGGFDSHPLPPSTGILVITYNSISIPEKSTLVYAGLSFLLDDKL